MSNFGSLTYLISGDVDSENREESNPLILRGLSNLMYVCNRDNHLIQVFDLDLNFIGCNGSKEEIKMPLNIAFDLLERCTLPTAVKS